MNQPVLSLEVRVSSRTVLLSGVVLEYCLYSLLQLVALINVNVLQSALVDDINNNQPDIDARSIVVVFLRSCCSCVIELVYLEFGILADIGV